GYGILVHLILFPILNRQKLQRDNERFSRQRMIEIEYSRLWKYPHDLGSPACIIYNIAFPGLSGQNGCRDSLNLCFIVRTKPFFHRQRKCFGFSRLHARHLLLERGRDNMLTLYELFSIDVGRGRVIAKRDLIPNRHFRSVPHSIVGSLYKSRKCLDKIHYEPMPKEQGSADRTQEKDVSCKHARPPFLHLYIATSFLVRRPASVFAS